MSRRCELTGIAVQTGNKVSHSNHRTRTRFLPNLCRVTLISDTLGRAVRLRVAAAALRTVEHRGGLDNFLLKARDGELSAGAVTLKREIVKKQAEAEACRAQGRLSRFSKLAVSISTPSAARPRGFSRLGARRLSPRPPRVLVDALAERVRRVRAVLRATLSDKTRPSAASTSGAGCRRARRTRPARQRRSSCDALRQDAAIGRVSRGRL